MSFGFSGAEIFFSKDKVLKKTPKAEAQVRQMQALTWNVCPKVLEVAPNYFIMERLMEPTLKALTSRTMMRCVFDLLTRKVHCFPNEDKFADDWRQELQQFLSSRSPALNIALFRLYPTMDSGHYCLTHGDATLANVLVTDTGHIKMIDPLPPAGKIPPLKEVDYGKLMQSALGWESLVICEPSTVSSETLVQELLLNIPDPMMQNKTWFWCAVHLLRILPYAQHRPDVYSWCELKFKECLNAIRF